MGSCKAIEALGRSTGFSLLVFDKALVQQRGTDLLVLAVMVVLHQIRHIVPWGIHAIQEAWSSI
jgi:hypothetical protein